MDEVYPVSIPHHGNKDLALGTQRSVLDALEEDVLVWEERLSNESDDEEPEDEDSEQE